MDNANDSSKHGLTLAALAERIGGRLVDLGRNPLITGIAPIAEAGVEQITFLSDAKKVLRHQEELRNSKAAAVIAPEKAPELPLPSIRFPNPYVGFVAALKVFHPEHLPPKGIHPAAFVDEKAQVHPSASIGPFAVVEAKAVVGAGARIDAQCFIGRGATVGAGSHLHPRVTVLTGCTVGERCIIHSGTVLGSDGYGFTPTPQGHLKVPQVGIVTIGNDVELGANVCVDRATMGVTSVGDGTKIDNQVHIAHNCAIGRNCLIVAQVGLSGSTIVEDGCVFAGQTGTVGHVRIGKGTTVAARGVVTEDLPPGSMVSGFPCKPHTEEKRIMAAQRRLPELVKSVREIERAVRTLGGALPDPEAATDKTSDKAQGDA